MANSPVLCVLFITFRAIVDILSQDGTICHSYGAVLRGIAQLVAHLIWEKRFLPKIMLERTQQKGTLTELHCIMDLTAMGVRCLTPVDEGSKYDVVADVNGKFLRIQCKTASWARDTMDEKVAFEICTCRQTTNTRVTIRYKYSKDDIDYFYTWFNGQGYLVSIEEATGITFRWRYEYPKSGQRQGIHIAENYKIEEVLKAI